MQEDSYLVVICFSLNKLFYTFCTSTHRPTQWDLICKGSQLLATSEVNQKASISGERPYLQNYMVLYKLSKAIKGKTNKAYDKVASFSKIPTLNKCKSKIFKAKAANAFKRIQIQQTKSYVKHFYFIVSEQCCYCGSDQNINVWTCFAQSLVSFRRFCLRLRTLFVYGVAKSQTCSKLLEKRPSRFLFI